MMLKTITIRAALALTGLLCGAIPGYVIARVLTQALPFDAVARTNGIVVGTAIGAGMGYGAYRILYSRQAQPAKSQSDPK